MESMQICRGRQVCSGRSLRRREEEASHVRLGRDALWLLFGSGVDGSGRVGVSQGRGVSATHLNGPLRLGGRIVSENPKPDFDRMGPARVRPVSRGPSAATSTLVASKHNWEPHSA